MDEQKIIQDTAEYVEQCLKHEESSHDWQHSKRVWKLSKHLHKKEGGNFFIIELAALLHNIADWKFYEGDESLGSIVARTWLETLDIPSEDINQICSIIYNISFKGAHIHTEIQTIEAKIVQDADQLDALGAIGIARSFAFGGYKKKEMYNPEIQPTMHKTFDEYKNSMSPTINHFYEKLLLLKDRMNTNTAKMIAKKRHSLIETFLKDFFEEWNFESEKKSLEEALLNKV